jgi:hypothetical protein
LLSQFFAPLFFRVSFLSAFLSDNEKCPLYLNQGERDFLTAKKKLREAALSETSEQQALQMESLALLRKIAAGMRFHDVFTVIGDMQAQQVFHFGAARAASF